MDQPKLERLLRLMKLLTANTTYNIDQLAERLQMSRRTVYRYIDTFRDAGFVIKKSGDCIRLDKESPHFRDISQLVHFTEEEAVILKSAIENIDDNNVLKQNLKRKLYSVYDNKTLADTVGPGQERPEHPAADRSHRGAAAGGAARLPVAARRRGPRPPGGAFRLHDQLRAGVVLRPRKPLEQALQNLAHRLRGALRRGVGTRCRTRRRLHRRIPHARRNAPPRTSGTGHAGLQPAVRGVPAGRTRPETAGPGPLGAGHRSRRHGRGGPLRRGAAGRHPHRRFARADEIHPGIPRGECAAGRRGGRILFFALFHSCVTTCHTSAVPLQREPKTTRQWEQLTRSGASTAERSSSTPRSRVSD